MRIDNNQNAMLAAQMQVNQNAQTVASSAIEAVSEETVSNSGFTNAMVDQIPQIFAYEANAEGIKTQEAMLQTLLDIKA